MDISGTLHIGENPTRDAVQALKRLQQSGIAVKLITNGTQRGRIDCMLDNTIIKDLDLMSKVMKYSHHL